jgi:hypothetical protein
MNKGGPMIDWRPEPYWKTLALQPPVAITAADTLRPSLADRACLPRLASTNYRGFDVLKSRMAVGQLGVIIRS